MSVRLRKDFLGERTDAASSDAGVAGMDLGRHPLSVDDELVPRTADVDFGNLLDALDRSLDHGRLDGRLCMRRLGPRC